MFGQLAHAGPVTLLAAGQEQQGQILREAVQDYVGGSPESVSRSTIVSTTSEQSKPLLVHVAAVARSFYYAAQLGQMRYMKDNGFRVMVVANPDEVLRRFAREAGINALGISMKRAISPLRDLLAIWSIYWRLRKLKPQIVHAHTPKGGLVGMIGAFLAGVRIRVYHVHGLPHLTARGVSRRLLMSAEYVSCSLAHRVYFVSPSIRGIALESGLCAQRKARMLCHGSINGVDARLRFNPDNYNRAEILREMRIPAEAQVIGFIGRIVNDKGVRELMQAWEELRDENRNLYLLIAGPMEDRDAIPADVKAKMLGDERVRYLGEVDDTAPLYKAMDVLAFPTYREGLPLVPLEASAMEVPVVATEIPGCVDAVVDSVTGVIVPAGNAPALKIAVESYLRDPILRRKHGENGRKRALSDFCPDDIWEAQRAEYIDMMKS